MSENKVATRAQLLRSIMANNEIPDFVVIEEHIISPEEREALAESLNKKGTQKVDLVKLAYYYIQGYNTKELSEIFDADPQHINRIKASDKFRAIITSLNAEIVSTARTFLTAAGFKAVKTLLMCMDSNDDRVKLNAATQVLDRIGLKTPEQIEVIQKGAVVNKMSDEELMGLIKLGTKELLPIVEADAVDDTTKT